VDEILRHARPGERGGEGLQRRALAMGQEQPAPYRQAGARPGHKLVAVGVAGIEVDLADAGAHGDVLAHDPHRLAPLGQQRAERALRLITHQQHGGFRLAEQPLEVVAHPARVAHAAGGDDDRARAHPLDGLALLHRLGEAQPGMVEGAAAGAGVLKRARVLGEHLGRADGERRVEKHLRLRDVPGVHQRDQVGQQLLRALEREGGDQQHAVVRQRRAHFAPKARAPLVRRDRLARAAAIGALAQQIIHIAWRVGRGVEQLVVRADVAREQQPQRGCVAGLDLDLDGRGAEDVPGVPPARPQAGGDGRPSLVVHGAALRHRGGAVGAGVDRRQRRGAALAVAAVEALDLLLLDIAAVGQHERQQRPRAFGGVDRPGEALPDQLRRQPGVVDMGMGQQQRVDGGGVEGKIGVVQRLQRLGPLEHAAVDQRAAPARRQQEARPGDRACAAAEFQRDLGHDAAPNLAALRRHHAPRARRGKAPPGRRGLTP